MLYFVDKYSIQGFMRITIENFDDFISGSWDYDDEKEEHTGIWVRSETADVTGGRASKEDIDCLSLYDNIETITVSGLNQETFEYLITKYGDKLRAVRFFKNKMVEDWSLLGTLENLEFVYWFHNQRITKMWDMSKNFALKGLCISDFSRLKILDGIEKAPALEWFSFRDAVWYKNEVESYTCFRNTNVKYLNFGAKNIKDGDISFVKDMPKLEIFDCGSNLFETEKFAWVIANCPHIMGCSFKIFIEDYICNKTTGDYDVPALVLPGKGKRKFPVSDEKKKKEQAAEFTRMLEQFKGREYDEIFNNSK